MKKPRKFTNLQSLNDYCCSIPFRLRDKRGEQMVTCAINTLTRNGFVRFGWLKNGFVMSNEK